jgi:hypothetical protein
MTPRGGQWRRMSHLDRIMSRVERTPDGHWMWLGSRCGLRREYGQTTLRGQRMVAHRAVWKVLGRPLPDELDLLHQCGQTLCVNPDHVRPGTHAENIREALGEHGSWSPRGERHPAARLTWAQVCDIRDRYAAGARQSVLAADFGVAQPHISAIVHGRRWKVAA